MIYCDTLIPNIPHNKVYNNNINNQLKDTLKLKMLQNLFEADNFLSWSKMIIELMRHE